MGEKSADPTNADCAAGAGPARSLREIGAELWKIGVRLLDPDLDDAERIALELERSELTKEHRAALARRVQERAASAGMDRGATKTLDLSEADSASSAPAGSADAASETGGRSPFAAALEYDERARERGYSAEASRLLWLAAKQVPDVPADLLDGDRPALARWLIENGHLTALQAAWIAADERPPWREFRRRRQAAERRSPVRRAKTPGAAEPAVRPATGQERPVGMGRVQA